MSLTDEEIKNLAIVRANEIIEAWWEECRWEFAEEHELSDEDLARVLDTPVYLTTEIEE